MTQLNVRILSLQWKNIRSFRSLNAPNKEGEKWIDWPKDKSIWLQMPNGTGKTTTLHLLRSIFTGEIWSKRGESPKQHKWRRIITTEGKKSYTNSPSSFLARLEINSEIYGIELLINHDDGTHRFITHTPHGKRQGWEVPSEFRRIFGNNKRLVELFLFDAETSRQMTGKTDTSLLENAIRQFGGMSNVFDLIGEPDITGEYRGGKFGTLIDELIKDIGKLKDDGGGKIKNWKRGLEEIKKVRNELQKDISKEKDDRERFKRKLDGINKKLDKIEDDYGNKFEEAKELKEKISELEKLKIEHTSELRKQLMNPMRTFKNQWDSFVNFHRKHQDDNLPEKVGKGWFLSIADGEKCICGKKITTNMKRHIRNESHKYLSTTKMNSVSAVQSAFSSNKTADNIALQEAYKNLKDISAQLTEKISIYETEFAILADEKIQKQKKELDRSKTELEKNIESCDFIIRKRTTNNRAWLHRDGFDAGIVANGFTTDVGVIKVIENLGILTDVEKNLRTLIQNSQGFNKEWNGIQLTRKVIGRALQDLSDEMRNDISEIATKTWTEMPAAGSEGQLQITIQEDGMKFYRGNNEAEKVSGAQTVSACYSVAKAVASLGNISVPLVCDTPFSGMDEDMYEPTYQNITNSFNQCIALINTGEKKILKGSIWNKEHSDFRATIHQPFGKIDMDGGKYCVYTEDNNLFEKLSGSSYKKS